MRYLHDQVEQTLRKQERFDAVHVIETFGQDPKAVYRRCRDKGRQMPEGLEYVDSWVAADFTRCFQLMRCEDMTLLQRWVAAWSDLVGFEIVPVATSKETAAAIEDQL